MIWIAEWQQMKPPTAEKQMTRMGSNMQTFSIRNA